MSDVSFGFFSEAGEVLARKLIQGIAVDIACDRTSRRRALDRVAEATERAAGLDGMPVAQDVLDSIADYLQPSFASAKFMPLSRAELGAHCEAWSRNGSAAGAADVCAAAVFEAAAAARKAAAVAHQLSGRRSLDVFASALTPYEDGFCDAEGCPPGDVVLFPWQGETGGHTYVGCVLIGDEGAAYIEDVVSAGAADAMRAGLLGQRSDEDCEAIAQDLASLAAEIRRFNISAAQVPEPSRLTLRPAPDAPVLHVLWDGDPLPLPAVTVAAARSRKAPEPLAVAEAVSALGFAGEEEPLLPAMR